MFKKSSNNQAKNDFWIGFSDLMTGLMLVFIILSLTFMAIAKEKLDEIQQQKKNIIIILSEKLSNSDIKVEYDSEKGTVTISQNILFDLKSSDLSKEGKSFIKLFANVLDKNIFAEKKYNSLIKYIHIEGYTSRDGYIDYNFNLSFRRAKNVWYYMTENKSIVHKNIMRKKLNIVSRGEIDANQKIENPKDRKVVFRFEFYDSYNKIFEGLSRK